MNNTPWQPFAMEEMNTETSNKEILAMLKQNVILELKLAGTVRITVFLKVPMKQMEKEGETESVSYLLLKRLLQRFWLGVCKQSLSSFSLLKCYSKTSLHIFPQSVNDLCDELFSV